MLVFVGADGLGAELCNLLTGWMQWSKFVSCDLEGENKVMYLGVCWGYETVGYVILAVVGSF